MTSTNSEASEVSGADDKQRFEAPPGIWMRGLWMLILAVMFGIAETVLAIGALVQFLWMLFSREKNQLLVEFGRDLGRWMSDVAAFQTGVTEDKPFPWKRWGE